MTGQPSLHQGITKEKNMVGRWLSQVKSFEIFSDIVKFLKSNDHVIVSRAVEMVNGILEKEDGREMVVNTSQMVVSLVEVLNSSNDLETTECISKILLCLSQCQTGLLSIYQSNGIPVLIQLLSASAESLVTSVVVTLHNLLQNQEGSKEAVCKVDGLQKMMILLKHNNEQILCIVIDCLYILAYRDQNNKLLIFYNDGPAELVRIISTSSFETLLYTTSRLLRVLSTCSSNKRAIIAAGGMQALAKYLNYPSEELVISCLWTLQNLSDCLTKQGNVMSILKILVQFLRSSDRHIVACTAGILSNLTCNNDYNKVIVCQEMGISALVNAIFEAGNTEEIIEPVIRSLRHCTREHPEAETAQNDVRLYLGLEPIVKLLQPSSSWSLIKAVIGLVRNLTLCPRNHEPLRELGAVDILKNMLNFFYPDITKKRDSLSCFEKQSTVIEGVKREDIVQGILSAMLNLARNVNVRVLMKDDEIINTLVRILREENENIQCIVVGLFCEIASGPGGILIIESTEMVPFLCTFLESENQALASQSGSLMAQLFTLKSKKYECLSTDLNNIMRNNTSIPSGELLESSQSVISESGYLESQSSFSCPSGSRSVGNQGFDLQPMQNLTFEELEDLDINMDLNISPDLDFDSTFDALQLSQLSFCLNDADGNQEFFSTPAPLIISDIT